MASRSAEEFSVLVLASDLGVDARSLLSAAADVGESSQQQQQPGPQQQDEVWHDCPSSLISADGEDFSDIEALQAFRVDGVDKAGSRIFRIVGKFFPAPVISGERLKKYIFNKIASELSEGPFCIVYIHSTVQKEDNSPGLSILRWIYEELSQEDKERLRVVYFIHPGIQSRLIFATLGRFFLSGGLYWKIKYISRLQYLWQDVKKGEVEIPKFVQDHDEVLEHRPLTDYGIEPDTLHLSDVPAVGYSLGRHEERWNSQPYS